ncbi:MAG: hypothetical protein CVU34_07360 [Betaproteobacteria bacterium HGW-Betaproteobacteria-7]|jgi:uncharacterized membrane protein YhaH (DUF805 family)|nr:MAG: hypothetical protein CVU34_07360 [Betaproteobacteria bacterium HGW-Betaproteobacteria-7]
MELEPPSLNIPLERKEHWGIRLVVAAALVTVAASFVNPAFATAFAAAAIVGLPVLLVLVFPSRFPIKLSPSRDLGRIGFYLVLFGYIALAKSVLVPIVIGVIERALSI